jgi:iron(II)-dependent oxidoreductase
MRALRGTLVVGLLCVGSAWAQKAPVAPETLGALVEIPAGRFAMGNEGLEPRPNGTIWKVNERPRRLVELEAYAVHRTEVTVQMWAEFLNRVAGETAWHRLQPVHRAPDGTYGPAVDGHTPISGVSWLEARAFCRWHGLDLPTEAQWERAAHGPGEAARTWPWGERAPDCRTANLHNGRTSCHDGPLPVGTTGARGASPEGVEDLSGNVAEWVLDFEAPTHDALDLVEPKGPAEGRFRVIRGGSFIEWTYRARVTARLGARPERRSRAVGFRCVRQGGL